MKAFLQIILALTLAAALNADEIILTGQSAPVRESDTFADLTEAQPKLLRITAMVDGSGKIIFTRQSVCYEHKQWGLPTNVIFGGEPWLDLSRTPPAWLDTVGHLDLTKAWIVKRKGRDVIALEQTPDGFDLYLCDSPNGAADYEVVIAIPRRR